MTPVQSFYRNLESKCCATCGDVIVEQAESYMNECFHCQEKEYIHYLVLTNQR